MEPTPCTCSCHQRSVTCDPCWRLHTVVREMRAMLTGARDQAAVMMAAHPSIKDWLEGKRDAYGDALTTLDIWAAHGGDAPVEAIEPDPEHVHQWLATGVCRTCGVPGADLGAFRCPECPEGTGSFIHLLGLDAHRVNDRHDVTNAGRMPTSQDQAAQQ